MRTVFGLMGLDRRSVCWQGVPITATMGSRSGCMPEERGLYPRMQVRDQLVYLGRLGTGNRTDVLRSVDTWLERLGLSDRAQDRLDALSHGNQQRVQPIAALVTEPDLVVLDEHSSGRRPHCHHQHVGTPRQRPPPAERPCVSPAISSTSSKTCAWTSSSSTAATSSSPATSTRCAPRSPSVRGCPLRGVAPDWTRLAPTGLIESDGHATLRVDGDADLEAVAAFARRGTDLVSFSHQPPTLSELFR